MPGLFSLWQKWRRAIPSLVWRLMSTGSTNSLNSSLSSSMVSVNAYDASPKPPQEGPNFQFICDHPFRGREVPLMDAVALRISSRKRISKALGKLRDVRTEIAHLKRVKEDMVVAAKLQDGIIDEIKQALSDLKFDYEMLIVKVPVRCPLTRSQYAYCQEIWPVHFRVNEPLEAKLSDQYFIDEPRRKLHNAFELLDESDGCVIVDGKEMEIQARACDSRLKKHDPLKHPFMRALEHFCEKQRISRKRSATREQYLYCYVVLEHEPCAMCAMAMVHARVKTAFFKNTSTNGAFVTNCQLHLNPKLNHHFEVYRVNELA